jgi:type II secretory ATPase GspE/PulE/Tfp pilus assembly ATPase PilB-like protein
VISGLEIQYVCVPQDGSFPIKIGDQRYDFRVNTSYHAQGEQAVPRLQRDNRTIKALDQLKMAISQRLVKKVCPRCYVEEPVPARAQKLRSRNVRLLRI